MSENKCNEGRLQDSNESGDGPKASFEETQCQIPTFDHGSDHHHQYQEAVPFHPVQPIFVNPNRPDLTYLTPYASSADLQHMTPGPLYEIHFQYNQSPIQSEPHYLMIHPNYGCHQYNYSPMPYPGHFFHNRLIAPFHHQPPPNIHPYMPGTIFYPHYWHGPYPQYASHPDPNPHNQQLLSAETNDDDNEEMTTTGDLQDKNEMETNKNQSYIVEEPESRCTSPLLSSVTDITEHRTQ